MLSLSTIGDAKVSKKKRIREGFDSLVKRHRNPLKARRASILFPSDQPPEAPRLCDVLGAASCK